MYKNRGHHLSGGDKISRKIKENTLSSDDPKKSVGFIGSDN